MLFKGLQWFPFYEEVKIAQCCVAYKCIKDGVPLCIKDYLRLNSQHINMNFICPKFNQLTEGSRMFTVTTCQLWSSISLDPRNAVPLESFENNYQNIIFKEQQEQPRRDGGETISNAYSRGDLRELNEIYLTRPHNNTS